MVCTYLYCIYYNIHHMLQIVSLPGRLIHLEASYIRSWPQSDRFFFQPNTGWWEANGFVQLSVSHPLHSVIRFSFQGLHLTGLTWLGFTIGGSSTFNRHFKLTAWGWKRINCLLPFCIYYQTPNCKFLKNRFTHIYPCHIIPAHVLSWF